MSKRLNFLYAAGLAGMIAVGVATSIAFKKNDYSKYLPEADANGPKEALRFSFEWNWNKKGYGGTSGYRGNDLSLIELYKNAVYGFDLKPGDMVVSYKQVEPVVANVYTAVTGNEIPDNLDIFIFTDETFDRYKKVGKITSNGFRSLIEECKRNSNGFFASKDGEDYVFVRANKYVEIMDIIGHEIGHVVTQRLEDKTEKEFEAIRFENMWLKELRNPRYNIIK